jgi:hypothetical protein
MPIETMQVPGKDGRGQLAVRAEAIMLNGNGGNRDREWNQL